MKYDKFVRYLGRAEKPKQYGYHLIAELSGCNHKKISDTKYLLDKAYEVCDLSNLDVMSSYVVNFSGKKGGASIILILKQSHISIHTWPEKEYAGFDVYSCGDNHLNTLICGLYFAKEVSAESIYMSFLWRGFEDPEDRYRTYVHNIEIHEKKMRQPTDEEMEKFKKAFKEGNIELFYKTLENLYEEAKRAAEGLLSDKRQ